MSYVQSVCEDVWCGLWSTMPVSPYIANLTGHEYFPAITYSDYTMTTGWRSRRNKTLEGRVWWDGSRIFSYVLYLKYRGRTDPILIIEPRKSNTLLALVFAYEKLPTRFMKMKKTFFRDYDG